VTTGPCVLGMDLEKVLKQLNLSFESFVDLCIMLGCDYNTRIFKVGPKKVWNLIQTYGCIEDIPDIDTTSLDYEKCRKIFEYQPSEVKELNMKKDLVIQLDIFNSKDIELKLRLDRVKQCLMKLPEPSQAKMYRNPYLL
jgi:flap endonuclease-1